MSPRQTILARLLVALGLLAAALGAGAAEARPHHGGYGRHHGYGHGGGYHHRHQGRRHHGFRRHRGYRHR